MLCVASLAYLQTLTHIVNEKIGLAIYLFAISVLLATRVGVLRRRISSVLPLASIFIVGAIVSIAYDSSVAAISYFKSLLYLIGALSVWATMTQAVKLRALRYLTIIAIFAVLCIGIGSFYASHGGGSQFATVNLDGKLNRWYLTTFTRENYEGVIRPAWIFDEPGTLSYFLTTVALAREFAGMRRLPTLIIIMGGLISYSTAHLLVAMLYVLYLLLSIRGRVAVALRPIMLVGIPLLGVLPMTGALDDFFHNSQFLSRIDQSQGLVSGNNRATQIKRYVENVSGAGLVFGYPTCQDNQDKGDCRSFSDQTSNIFTPMFYGGIIYALPFYILLVYLLVRTFGLRHLPVNTRVLLLMFIALEAQRPYFYMPSYVFLSLFAVGWALPGNRLFDFFVVRNVRDEI